MANSLFSRRTVVGGGVALAGATLMRPRAARAATKVRVLTNWFAEAEHGGFYQALATGLYEKAGLEVEIRPGNAQLNGMQLLLATQVPRAASLRWHGSYESRCRLRAFERGKAAARRLVNCWRLCMDDLPKGSRPAT